MNFGITRVKTRKMPNIQNLKPFKKGDPRASAAGKKSKRKPLDHQWRDKLNEALADEPNRTILDQIFQILIELSAQGNTMAIRELLDRAYGKAVQFNVNADTDTTQANPMLDNIRKLREELKADAEKPKVIEVKDDKD